MLFPQQQLPRSFLRFINPRMSVTKDTILPELAPRTVDKSSEEAEEAEEAEEEAAIASREGEGEGERDGVDEKDG